jgi:hypothetical protein
LIRHPEVAATDLGFTRDRWPFILRGSLRSHLRMTEKDCQPFFSALYFTSSGYCSAPNTNVSGTTPNSLKLTQKSGERRAGEAPTEAQLATAAATPSLTRLNECYCFTTRKSMEKGASVLTGVPSLHFLCCTSNCVAVTLRTLK